MKSLKIIFVFLFISAFSTSKGSEFSLPLQIQSESKANKKVKTITLDSLLLHILDDYIKVFSSSYRAEIEVFGTSEFSENNHVLRIFQDSNKKAQKNIMILRFYFSSEIPFSDFNVLYYKGNYFYYKQEELAGIIIPEALMVSDKRTSTVIDSNFRDDYIKEICVIRGNTPMVFHYKSFEESFKGNYQLERKIYTYLETLEYNLWPINKFDLENQILYTSATDSDLEDMKSSESLRNLHRVQFRKYRQKYLKYTKYLRKVIDKWVIIN